MPHSMFIGINMEQMPLGNVTKRAINDGRQLLQQLEEHIKKLDELRREPIPNMDEIVEIREAIYDLSSAYYELIPQRRFAHDAISPINNLEEIKNHTRMLDELVNIEAAVKILLGSMHRVKEISPLDYIYKCLEVKLDILRPDDNEYLAIHNYYTNTSEGCGHSYTIETIYRLQRRGEAGKQLFLVVFTIKCVVSPLNDGNESLHMNGLFMIQST